MMKHKWTAFLVCALVISLLLYSMTFVVQWKEIVIVTTFGKAGEPIDGSVEGGAGLHLKWPWPVQRLLRYDGRTFIFEDTHEQIQTRDKQNVLVTVYCAWRLKDPNTFLRSIRRVDKAEEALRDMVRSRKKEVVGEHPLSDFLNTDPKKMRLPELEQEILSPLRTQAARHYGVAIVALGIKSFGLPQKVTEQVIDNMISERNRYAEDYRARGKSDAELIKSRAQTARDQIIEFSRGLASDIRTEGDRAAAEYYKQFRKNERFAMFLRELEFLKEVLRTNTTVIGSVALHPSLRMLRDGPELPPLEGAVTAPAQGGKAKD